jgi:HD-GYP domain-containing protein (c-di-GMP phosphodiesterase class II)
MHENPFELIDVSELRTGMFVELELGWMAHPFPTGSFRISSDKQIETIRALGLKRVRYVPGKSDFGDKQAEFELPAARLARQARTKVTVEEDRLRLQRSELIDTQRRNLVVCERRFGEAVRQYKELMDLVETQPLTARAQCLEMISGYVSEISDLGDTAIHLLSQGSTERVALHPVNVTVLSLLLGKAMDLSQKEMIDLGVAAFLHDVGKLRLPERVRLFNEKFSPPEFKMYQEHVAQSLDLARAMEFPDGVLQAIANHHEMVDGSGFPARAKGAALSLPSKILALVNRYENLCNPTRPATALTPHEALSLIFAQFKARFDGVVMSAFIRMMGVYPPGSVIQLLDDRYAVVVSVNSSKPLKPRVFVHDPMVPRHEALILDLENAPQMGIRRSIKPTALPPEAIDYLMPRQRVCYFFEKSADAPAASRAAAI